MVPPRAKEHILHKSNYEPKSSLCDDKATLYKLPMLKEIFSSRQFYLFYWRWSLTVQFSWKHCDTK